MGLRRLAGVVEGGIPDGTSVLLNGSPGTGKSTLALQLLHDHLVDGGEAFHLSTEASPQQVLKQATLRGLDLAPHLGERLRFVDAYSWRAGRATEAKGIVAVGGLGDLSSLSIKLSELLDARDPARRLLVVLDSPSTLTLHAAPTSILKFLEVAFAKVKSGSGSVLALVERDMHEASFIAALSAMADGVLDFRIVEQDEELVRQVRVLSMRTALSVTSRWMRLGLTQEGIALSAAAAKASA